MNKVISSIKSLALRGLGTGINLLLPFHAGNPEVFGADREKLRKRYIELNNKSVRYELIDKPPKRVLLLLPHCMQYKNCGLNIVEDVNNCRRCGSCKTGEAADTAQRYGIRAVVAKGGTAARNTVLDYKPDFIIAIACERELVSGIYDVGRIPVIGIINQRPDGYCTNTTVDMLELGSVLREFGSPQAEETALPIAYKPYDYIK